MVRAKFKCEGVRNQQISLNAVVDGSEENKEFWKYTPAGVIHMHIDNPQALEKFEVGKEYFVDFTLAE